MSKKLHLGSGGMVLPGYINTDIDEGDGVDLTIDATKTPYFFDDNILDEIKNSHMIEHLEYETIPAVLKEWHRILRPGGKVVIDVPHMGEAIKMLSSKDGYINGMLTIFGNNERVTQHHRWGYTPETLTKLFLEAGFVSVKEVPSDDYHIKLGNPTFRLEAVK